MQKLSILVVLTSIVTCVLAAARVYPYEPKPPKYACRVGCYLSELDLVLPYEKPYYPKGKCEVFNCQQNNQTFWYSCGVIAVLPGCRIVEDRSKHYPDCCSKAKCDTTTTLPSTAATCDDSATTEATATTEA